MTDGEALYKAILANPFDDTPRLIYADWLEENDQHEHAAFIRYQIEQAVIDSDVYAIITRKNGSAPNHLVQRHAELVELTTPILAKYQDQWTQDIPSTTPCSYCCASGVVHEFGEDPGEVCFDCQGTGYVPPFSHIKFHRGFVSSIQCHNLQTFIHLGPSIFRLHPIESVSIVDRFSDYAEESNGGKHYRWWDSSKWPSINMRDAQMLPHDIFVRLPGGIHDTAHGSKGYTTRVSANNALQSALFLWARKRAGLPTAYFKCDPDGQRSA